MLKLLMQNLNFFSSGLLYQLYYVNWWPQTLRRIVIPSKNLLVRIALYPKEKILSF